MSDSEQTAVVTGAGGFVGRHLTARLIADGWRTVATHLAVQPPPSSTTPAQGDLEQRTLDVRNAEAVESLIGEARPDWKLELLPDVGHIPMIEIPDRFVAVVQSWLKALAAPQH